MDLIPAVSAEECLPKVCDLVSLGKIDDAIQMLESVDGLSELCEKASYAETIPWQHLMGWKHYEHGDPKSALTWFEKAIEQGDVNALYGAGVSYLALKEYTPTIFYLQKAADAGLAVAAYLLGSLYLEGGGVEKDEAMMKKWLGFAASNGVLAAEIRLARYNATHGNFFSRIPAILKAIFVLIKTFSIAIKDADDPRLIGLHPAKEYKINV
jgi:TPR repeat protein